ncbi:MAG: hypothetical protein WCN98_00915 [Verrucomicrobiaceae bacterium]
MSTIRPFIIAAVFCTALVRALAQSPIDVITQALQQVEQQPRSLDISTDKAAQALAAFSAKEACDALYEKLQRADPVGNQHPAIMKISRKLSSFDIDGWVGHLEVEPAPMTLYSGLSVAFASKESHSPKLKAFAQRLLSDQRIGEERHGEARGYASKGLRVCDHALNLLWHIEPKATQPSGFPVDAINSTQRRDQMIADYAKKFGVTLIASEDANPLKEPPKGHPPATAIASPGSNIQPSPPNKEQQTSTAWLMWLLVVITATVGAVWVFLRKSK